jgi:hypothetical protein
VSAARTQCINNFKQIGLAVHNFVDVNQKVPNAWLQQWNGHGADGTNFGPNSPNRDVTTMWHLILPYLEQDSLYFYCVCHDGWLKRRGGKRLCRRQ